MSSIDWKKCSQCEDVISPYYICEDCYESNSRDRAEDRSLAEEGFAEYFDNGEQDSSDFGCCFGEECLMQGEHFASECFTAEMAQDYHEQREAECKREATT